MKLIKLFLAAGTLLILTSCIQSSDAKAKNVKEFVDMCTAKNGTLALSVTVGTIGENVTAQCTFK